MKVYLCMIEYAVNKDGRIYIYIKKSNEIRMLVHIKEIIKKITNGFFTTFLY